MIEVEMAPRICGMDKVLHPIVFSRMWLLILDTSL